MTDHQPTPAISEAPAVRGALCTATYGANGVLRPGMHAQAWGFADVANERPNTVDTRFAESAGE